MNSPRKDARSLLQAHAITHPPVPVDRIAESEGIRVFSVSAAPDVSGAIIKRGEEIYIAVNPMHSVTRRRFTVAHELGHHFCGHGLDRHVDHDFRIAWRNSASSRAVDWREVEANRFAAELLMPESFIRVDLEKMPVLNEASIKALSNRYKVSELAMRVRLTALGLIADEFKAEFKG